MKRVLAGIGACAVSMSLIIVIALWTGQAILWPNVADAAIALSIATLLWMFIALCRYILTGRAP